MSPKSKAMGKGRRGKAQKGSHDDDANPSASAHEKPLPRRWQGKRAFLAKKQVGKTLNAQLEQEERKIKLQKTKESCEGSEVEGDACVCEACGSKAKDHIASCWC